MPYRFRHRRRSNPSDSDRAAAVVQIAAADPRADVVPTRVVDIVQMHIGDGAAAAPGVANRGHIGGRAGNGDVVVRVGGAPVNGSSLPVIQSFEVVGRVGGRRREERRQGVKSGGRGRSWILKKGVARFVGVLAVIVAAGSDGGRHIVMRPTSGRAAENPKRRVGVVSARENVQVQLRLPLLQRNQRERRHYQRR